MCEPALLLFKSGFCRDEPVFHDVPVLHSDVVSWEKRRLSLSYLPSNRFDPRSKLREWSFGVEVPLRRCTPSATSVTCSSCIWCWGQCVSFAGKLKFHKFMHDLPDLF